MRWLILLLLLINVGYFFWAGSAAGRLNNIDSSMTIVSSNNPANENIDPQLTIELLPVIDVSENLLLKTAGSVTANNIDDIFCWYIGFNQLNRDTAKNSDHSQIDSDRQKAEVNQSIAKIQQRLLAVGIEGRAEDMKIALPKQYLIYLPPAESQAKAVEKLKWLLAAGYDAYILQRGKLENGISLDSFSLRLGAEKALQRYIDDGVDAQLKVMEEYRSERWLKLSQIENGKIVDRLWRRFETDWPGLIRQKNYCQSIAPAGDIE